MKQPFRSYLFIMTLFLTTLVPLPAGAEGLSPEILKRADHALKAPSPSVMEKTFMPENWDIHDYSSPSRYAWPDPDQAGGLPWKTRDGFPNYDRINESDQLRLSRLVGDVEALTDAWGTTGREDYAAKAALDLHTWFLAPATRMNPNFKGAQFVPGRNRGQGGGLIDFSQVYRLLDACRALEGWKGWAPEDQKGLEEWFTAYLGWLDTDQGAAAEARTKNNHATWFAVQRASILVYLGKDEEARDYLGERMKTLSEGQFDPDGKQPLEASRVDGISYSLYNLQAWEQLEALGGRVGVQGDQPAVLQAVTFLRPYADHPETWPWSQKDPLSATDRAVLDRLGSRSPAS